MWPKTIINNFLIRAIWKLFVRESICSEDGRINRAQGHCFPPWWHFCASPQSVAFDGFSLQFSCLYSAVSKLVLEVQLRPKIYDHRKWAKVRTAEQGYFQQDHLFHHCFKVRNEWSLHNRIPLPALRCLEEVRGETVRRQQKKNNTWGELPRSAFHYFSLLHPRNANLSRENSYEGRY